ncbi:MAG: type II secretion system pseudopilin OxpG [Nitrospirales bacterium]|nr:MAG: type II secretion system pseudopilin OxpG [Nitrospirales bacterium]
MRIVRMHKDGFTLLELLIVVAIAAILITLAVPSFQTSSTKAKEAALKQNLFTMRSLIDQFYADRGKYPATLEELVAEHYIRELPIDPFTKSSSSWEEILEEKDQEDDSPAGIYDVKSGSDLTSLDGRPYKEW